MTIDGRALIDAIPEEPPGPQGIPGSEGQQGIQGEPGSQGEPGVQGFQGVQGPPFAQAVVDGVTTLPPSDPATVQTTYDGVDVHFAFGTLQGYTGGRGRPGHKERRERCRWPN